VLIVLAVILVPSLYGAGRAAIACKMLGGGPDASAAPASAGSSSPGPEGYARREDQTYLTLPEWYIVYSADEYAQYLSKTQPTTQTYVRVENQPSGFPYFRAIGQFWDAYVDVCRVTATRYPFNSDYHLTLVVIGTSFTAENVFKGIYENTIGRLSEWTSNGQMTPEEGYGRQVAAEYGTFIHTIPWYEFPFGERLSGLWKLDLGGPNLIRRMERRFALSLEYGIKAGYGGAIKQATASVYAPEDLTIMARADGVTPEVLEKEPQMKIVEAGANGSAALVSLPRYEALTQLLPRLVEQGVRFEEIAGNRDVMITVLAPRGWQPQGVPADLLFRMPILTEPDRERIALRVMVPELHRVIVNLKRQPGGGAAFEHLYDY
jgi:hypothetical protein